jgi:hypothetical protein
MKPLQYLLIFLGAGIGFIAYNEVILLPYQTWDPSGFISREAMALRDPNINVGVVLGSYILLCVGSYAYVSYLELVKVTDLGKSLTDLSNMRDTTKRGSG